MEKRIIIKKYIELFEKLLDEKDVDKQQKIAKEISDFSCRINDEVEKKYWNQSIHNIQSSCIVMNHWKDKTGYCDLTKKDIKIFIKQLKEEQNKYF